MKTLRHISQNNHKPAANGNIYAFARDPLGQPFVVVKPQDSRWGVWTTVPKDSG